MKTFSQIAGDFSLSKGKAFSDQVPESSLSSGCLDRFLDLREHTYLELVNVHIPRPAARDSGPHMGEAVYDVMVPHEKR